MVKASLTELDAGRLEEFLEGIEFIVAHEPLIGQQTGQPGVLALPSDGEACGLPDVVVYYSFDLTDVDLESILLTEQSTR